MKKVLLASTALIGFAGAAAAEVSLSGYAEIGVKGGSGMETEFHNDIDVKFSLSGTSDNGLEFGATIDLDEVTSSGEVGGLSCTTGGLCGASSFNKSSVWVSGSFGKVTLGDTDGAFDWAMQEIYMGTSLTDDHSTHAGAYWNSGLDGEYDGQVLRYEYSFGDFAAAVSVEMDDSGALDPVLGLGVKWSGDMGGTDVSVGVGYQSVEGEDAVGLSVQAVMANGVQANLNYVDFEGDTWTGIGLGYTTGALMIQANYGVYDYAVDADEDGYGLVVNYDLGGGAVAMLGYGNGEGVNTWSAGLGLSF